MGGVQDIALVLTFVTSVSACVSRDFGRGGTVCVCNANVCDDLERVPAIPAGQFLTYTSSKKGLRFALEKKNYASTVLKKGVTYTVNSNITYQRVEGFGGAFTDSAGINIAALSEATQDKLLQSYFGPKSIGYTLGRVPIGGSDFSTRAYTYDDNDLDVELTHFNLTDEDHVYKIPMIQKAKQLTNDSLRLLAAAWSAPPWMKTNDDYIGLGFLKEDYYSTWAKYHLKFLEEYDKHGLRFWALSTGNEPSDGFIPFFKFNCMGWTPSGQRKWISQFFGPMLRESQFNQTLLLALDDQRFQLPWWIKMLLKDDLATPYISGIGVHWYWDNRVPLSFLDNTHRDFPDKFIIGTEACFTKHFWEDSPVYLGSWSRGEQYAENIMDDMNHWMVGWVDWNLALDLTGGPNWAKNVVDAAIIVNSTADEFYKQPMYYALGHFSKFVPPGSVRVDLEGGDKGLKGIAFQTPDNSLVVILINKKNLPKSVTIDGAPCEGSASFNVPAKSITTFICKNNSYVDDDLGDGVDSISPQKLLLLLFFSSLMWLSR